MNARAGAGASKVLHANALRTCAQKHSGYFENSERLSVICFLSHAEIWGLSFPITRDHGDLVRSPDCRCNHELDSS
jgi:hypothetical protein